MPGFDQTGPEGKGPATGGRRGKCATTNSEVKVNSEMATPVNEEAPAKDSNGEVYGIGRGGKPYGGGRGQGYGGGRRRRGFGRWQDNEK